MAGCLIVCLRWALVVGCLTVCLHWALVAGCLRWALVTGCLEEGESHPQENDHGTREGEWHMKAKQATAPVAAGAAKRMTKRLSRRSGG
ncbi:MAG: hypothetical protein L0331_23740 [Chloroflexi bacterium]|nr:hypothetical protein [Chloroflexota bacterium]MCI0645277.1 hypothetical protein [Chloroflexota bacterium]